MPENPTPGIDAYLESLKAALAGADKALVQDALWDAEDHLRSELARRRWHQPDKGEAELLPAILDAFGTPAEVAAAYTQREALVAEALNPLRSAAAAAPAETQAAEARPAEEAPRPYPGYFGVLSAPKAYTSMLYLLLSLATGIFFFTWTVTGLSLSLGLLVLIIGLPVALGFLGSVRVLALAEGRMVEAMLDVRMPRRQPFQPQRLGFLQRLKWLVTDGHTWTSIGYLLLKLPLGIFGFTLMITGLSLSLGLLAAPVVYWGFGQPMVSGWAWGEAHQSAMCVTATFVGILLVPLTLHIALLLGRLQGFLAKQLLVRI